VGAKKVALMVAAVLMTSPLVANATLVSDGTLDGGALITDTSTGLQWLSPVATSAQSYDAVVGGYDGLTTSDGFVVASQTQVLQLLSSNYPTLPTYVDTGPGTAAGYTAGSQFFSLFGIAENVTCPAESPPGPCPRTQGLTSTSAGSGEVDGVGVITLGGGATGSVGYGYYGWADSATTNTDPQTGIWLERPAPVPLSNAAWLLVSGLGGLGALARKKCAA
jgi:hypothetical protein